LARPRPGSTSRRAIISCRGRLGLLGGQVLAGHDPGAGFLGDRPSQRLLDGFAIINGAAGEGPLLAIPGDHDHLAVFGEAQAELG
jgi:hypothetical protein